MSLDLDRVTDHVAHGRSHLTVTRLGRSSMLLGNRNGYVYVNDKGECWVHRYDRGKSVEVRLPSDPARAIGVVKKRLV